MRLPWTRLGWRSAMEALLVSALSLGSRCFVYVRLGAASPASSCRHWLHWWHLAILRIASCLALEVLCLPWQGLSSMPCFFNFNACQFHSGLNVGSAGLGMTSGLRGPMACSGKWFYHFGPSTRILDSPASWQTLVDPCH